MKRVMMCALLAAACNGRPASDPGAHTPPTAASASEEIAPKHAVPKGSKRVASTKLIDRRERTALAADTLDLHGQSAAVPKSSAEIYRVVAPATVIVRVQGGLGSGILIDSAGWVLTNHHVIEEGKSEDFIKKATILVGELDKETGAMDRRDKEYPATVYKADKLRDIALLKIDDPPPNLASIKVAEKRPSPGDPVVALGHAGAGMLWALKSGQISALGKLSEHLATLASFEDNEDGKKAREAFQKFLDNNNLGMVIQSTCNILPGDSGGPLVNDQAELIGLNVFSRRDIKTGGLLSFHVHLNELKTFLENRPGEPVQLVPDPWAEGGGDLSWEDADLDGRVDVLMMEGRKPCRFCPMQSAAAFIDVDQDSFPGRVELPDLQEVFDKRSFDAEAVYLLVENNVFVWYDTDNDGRFDKLLVDQGIVGSVKAGYDIDEKGHVTRSSELSQGRPFRPSLFKDEKLHERFARITRAAFPESFTDAPASAHDLLPDPIGKAGSAMALDLNGDGKLDSADVTSPFSKRLLIDADQRIGIDAGVFFNLATLRPGVLDPEITVVSQGQQMWAFYDTDDDRRFDLALHAPGSRLYVATRAWTLDAQGNRTPAPEHVGRKLIRPLLLANQAQRETTAAMVTRGLLAIMAAKDEGESSFPDPVDDHRGAGYELLDVKGMPNNSVVTILAQGSDGYLLDLDASSQLTGPRGKIDLEQVVAVDRKFDAEFAYFQRNGLAWTYYDTNATRGWEIILVSTQPASGKADAGYRIEKGAARLDPTLAGKPLVRPSLFSGPMATRMKAAAGELFAAVLIEK